MQDNKLKNTIENIVKKIENIEKELQKHKKHLTSNATDGIDVKLFVKGKYIDFDEENQSLEILVEGNTRYYSLEDYYSKYLPFPDTTVVIFSEDGSKGDIAKIFATNKGEIDKISSYKSFVYKGSKNNQAIFHSFESAYLTFEEKDSLFEKCGLKIGQSVDFREIIWGTKIFYIPQIDKNFIKQDRLKILELIKENRK
ncbi:hypothetical protein [Arcobacter vandammei]|uniref:hypothetical protein n=1 Tax=Arcobacter vandammei TaxID=2782243 RepID=UPI0018E0131C|nr:hypothetical protein [Arcobacter vandammei]